MKPLKPRRPSLLQKYRVVLERGFLGIVLIAAALLCRWSVTRVAAAQRATSTINQRVSSIATEIDLMRANWTAAKTNDVAKRIAVARDNLFGGEAEIEQWREAVARDAIPLALQTDLKLSLTGIQTNAFEGRNLTLMEGSLELTPATHVAGTRSSYRRVVQMLQRLSELPQRLDMVRVSIEGGTNAVTRATASLELWAMESTPVPPSP